MRTNRLLISAALLCVLALAVWPAMIAAAPPPAPPLLAPVTAVLTPQPAIKAASTSGTSFTTSTNRTYTLIHTGVDSTGATATALVCIGIDAAPAAADYTEDNNKFPLASGSAIVVGPVIGVIHLKSASGAPMISILPGPTTPRP